LLVWPDNETRARSRPGHAHSRSQESKSTRHSDAAHARRAAQMRCHQLSKLTFPRRTQHMNMSVVMLPRCSTPIGLRAVRADAAICASCHTRRPRCQDSEHGIGQHCSDVDHVEAKWNHSLCAGRSSTSASAHAGHATAEATHAAAVAEQRA